MPHSRPMSSDAPTLEPALVEPASRSRLALFVAIALPVLAAFSPRDLWGPDEPRYGLVAREMVERSVVEDGAVVPRVAGEAFAEKPPLAFALMAGAGAVTGRVTAVVARLPCALLAALAVWMTARLARRWFGDPGLGDTAALLFSTTGLVLWNSSRAALDLPMTAFALVALDFGTTLVARRSLAAALGFGAAIGAALLTKGPHALLVPVAAIVGGCVAVRQARRLLDPRWLAGLALAAGLVLAWILPALAQAGGEHAYGSRPGVTYADRLLGQLSSRLTGENEPHDHGAFFLAPLLLAVALPWTPAWLIALARALRPSRAPDEDRFGLGAAAWGVLAPLALLSIPATQRELYLLPLLPCASILAAYALHRVVTDVSGGWIARGLVYVCAAVAAMGFVLPFVAAEGFGQFAGGADLGGDSPARVTGIAFASGAAAFLAAFGAVVAWTLRKNAAGAARATGVALGAAWLVFAAAVLPAFDPWKSLVVAGTVADREAPGLPLSIWGTSDASDLWWFPGRRLVRLGDVGYPEAAAALAPGGPRSLVLAREKVWRERTTRASAQEQAVFARVRVLWQRTGAGMGYVLLTNGVP